VGRQFRGQISKYRIKIVVTAHSESQGLCASPKQAQNITRCHFKPQSRSPLGGKGCRMQGSPRAPVPAAGVGPPMGKVPRILNLDNRWRREVSFTTRPLQPWGNSLGTRWIEGWEIARASLVVVHWRQMSCAYRKPRPYHAVCSRVATATEDRVGAGERIVQRIVLVYFDVQQTCRLRLKMWILSVVRINVTHCCTPSFVTDEAQGPRLYTRLVVLKLWFTEPYGPRVLARGTPEIIFSSYYVRRKYC
jgi:hypothetical protein